MSSVPGSLMGIYYKRIESNSVGYKKDYEMHSMDFEEFLWAKGYTEGMITELYQHIKEQKPLSTLEYDVLMDIFRDYMIVGGNALSGIKLYQNGNFSGTLEMQKQLHLDYEEDITKYAKDGLERRRY